MRYKKAFGGLLAIVALIIGGQCYQQYKAADLNGSGKDVRSDVLPSTNSEYRVLVAEDEYRPVGPDNDNRLKDLPVYYGYDPKKNTGFVGYINRDHKTFYSWKGVIYTKIEELPCLKRMVCGAGLPVKLNNWKVIEVDPHVHYLRLANDSYAPGYYENELGTFFQWQNVLITEKQIPQTAKGKRVLTNLERVEISPIAAPKHMLERPGRWRND
jgi:hypothetical protein